MSKAIVKRTEKTEYILSPEDIEILVSANVIPKNVPAPIIKFYGKVCQDIGLSPFKHQIHMVPRKDSEGAIKYNFQVSIDGYRAVASRTGLYAGSDDYIFDGNMNEYDHIQASRGNPVTASATVYKLAGNIRVPFTATSRWSEYYPGEKQGFMWKKMPYLMLGKCAEALALRKAFPEETATVYVNEEMTQADVQEVPEKGKGKKDQSPEKAVETVINGKKGKTAQTEVVEPPQGVEKDAKIFDDGGVNTTDTRSAFHRLCDHAEMVQHLPKAKAVLEFPVWVSNVEANKSQLDKSQLEVIRGIYKKLVVIVGKEKKA